MEAVKHSVVDMSGKQVGDLELDARVFDVPALPHLVHTVVRWQRAKRRAGTHAAKTRSEVSGSKKKPWRQKGTGRARAGARTSPLWRGGGVIFGPKPRDYEFRLNKQERRRALSSVLSEKRRQGKLLVLDSLAVDSGKTKDLAAVLNAVGVERSAALVLSGVTQNTEAMVQRAGRNIPDLCTLPVAGVNVYDLMKARYLVCTKDNVLKLQDRCLGLSTKSEEAAE